MHSDYQLFVKKHMLSMRDDNMKSTEKIKLIAKLWQKSKRDSSSDEENEEVKPRKPTKKSIKKGKANKDIDLSKIFERLERLRTK